MSSSVVPFAAPSSSHMPVAQEGSPFVLWVYYEAGDWMESSGWMLWEENSDNKHQLQAVEKFINLQQPEARICVPHCLGGSFVANFKRLSHNQVCYYRQSGTRVVFQFERANLLQQ